MNADIAAKNPDPIQLIQGGAGDKIQKRWRSSQIIDVEISRLFICTHFSYVQIYGE